MIPPIQCKSPTSFGKKREKICMSSHDLNSNPELVKQLIKQYQDAAASARQCPDSVLPAFERELHQLGFQF